MSGPSGSTSGSSAGGRERAPDIIDLDRYMRGGARPQTRHRTLPRLMHPDRERLVVDAGGPPVDLGPAGVPLGPRVPAPRPKSSGKRYSHDSGLSDGSYVRRRSHRRMIGEHASNRAHRERERERDMRAGHSSNSMRTFRATCERALRDQQEQIARVAQLCELLTQTQTAQTDRRGGAAARHTQPSVSYTQDSSDISSSSRSRSTRDKTRKDKYRKDECKTYKIIMNKLDELNRLFAGRARAPPPPRPPQPPRASSGGSVSVSDKLVCTEEPPTERQHRRPPPSSIAASAYATKAEVWPVLLTPRTPQSIGRSAIIQRLPPRLQERGVGVGTVVGRAAATPPPAINYSGRINVATHSHSVLEADSDISVLSRTPHCKYDLDNPLNLYYQARRLQERERSHSLDCDGPRHRAKERAHEHAQYPSLCGRCHSYWRTFTSLASQLFYKADTNKSDKAYN